jgi:uncharacterized RDD family membrane protein YckC
MDRDSTIMECPHCHRQTGVYDERCGACGGHIPASQHLLEESGIVAPPSPPTSAPPKEVWRAQPDDSVYRMATLGDRLIALAFDNIFLLGVLATVDAFAFMRWGVVDGAELQLTVAALLFAVSLNAAIFFLYFWLLEANFGATLGKAMVGIRVIQTTDQHPLVACAVRNLFRIVDGFGFYLIGAVVAGCSKIHRRLGDICAGTAVVEESSGAGAKVVAIALWLAVLAGSIWSVPRICKTNAARPVPYLNQVVVRVGRSGRSAYFKVASLHVDVEFAQEESKLSTAVHGPVH